MRANMFAWQIELTNVQLHNGLCLTLWKHITMMTRALSSEAAEHISTSAGSDIWNVERDSNIKGLLSVKLLMWERV